MIADFNERAMYKGDIATDVCDLAFMLTTGSHDSRIAIVLCNLFSMRRWRPRDRISIDGLSSYEMLTLLALEAREGKSQATLVDECWGRRYIAEIKAISLKPRKAHQAGRGSNPSRVSSAFANEEKLCP